MFLNDPVMLSTPAAPQILAPFSMEISVKPRHGLCIFKILSAFWPSWARVNIFLQCNQIRYVLLQNPLTISTGGVRFSIKLVLGVKFRKSVHMQACK